MSHSGKSAADDSGSAGKMHSRKKSAPYPAMLAYWDKNEICRFINNAGLNWFNKKAESVIGKMRMPEFLGPVLYSQNKHYIHSVLQGHSHVFERVLKSEGKGEISSVITYIPDMYNGETIGFFVHVADVGLINRKSEKIIADEKELLKAVIDIQEKERSSTAELLRDNVNQLLAYVNLMLQANKAIRDNRNFTDEMMQAIQKAILELNKLSNQLYPSGLSLLGLLASIENLLSNYRQYIKTDISFFCNDPSIEELGQHDKLAIYRIIQDFIALVLNRGDSRYIKIELNYKNFCLMIRFVYNGQGPTIDHKSDEFRDIRSRIEYYSGKIKEVHQEDEAVFITHLVFQPES